MEPSLPILPIRDRTNGSTIRMMTQVIAQRPVRTPPGQTQTTYRDEPDVNVAGRVAELTAQFDQLRAQVRQAQQLSTLGRAAATMAHEFNNLLTPILGYAKAALDSDDTSLQRKALEVTVKNVDILTAMSGRVLAIGAAKQGQRESVSLRDVIKDAADSLCRDLSKDGIQFHVEVDESLCVLADPLQIQQVLFNLFLNAREAMAPDHSGRLSVCAKRTGDEVRIEVSNTGEHIPDDLLPHIFEPLQTSKPTNRNGHERCGGLGLTLCRDLIEENEGTISVTSTPEAGTVFTITLPVGESSPS